MIHSETLSTEFHSVTLSTEYHSETLSTEFYFKTLPREYHSETLSTYCLNLKSHLSLCQHLVAFLRMCHLTVTFPRVLFPRLCQLDFMQVCSVRLIPCCMQYQPIVTRSCFMITLMLILKFCHFLSPCENFLFLSLLEAISKENMAL